MAKGTVNYLTIDGVKMPTPSKYTYVEADFDSQNSVRSETGVLNRDNIRLNVLSPEMSWNAITTAQLNLLLTAVNQSIQHEITIFDPTASAEENFQRTFTGYVQATRKPVLEIPRSDPAKSLWSVSLTFIEY